MHYLIIVLISLYVSYFMYSFVIPKLRKKKLGQNVRLDGPKSHYYKKGTPTLGGVVIILISIFCLICLMIEYKKMIYFKNIIIILISTIGFGLIGFIDDYRNIKYQKNEGIKPLTKLIMQIAISLIISFLLLNSGFSSTIKIFNFELELGFLYPIWVILFMLSVTNAVNITDGIDGLASGIVLIILMFLLAITSLFGFIDLNFITVSFAVALFGFMMFNLPPAKIFMGNTGSMAIGAIIGVIALMLKIEMLLAIVCIFPIIETLSVIIQVLYFKITKGKRLFPMSPIHHSLEKWGLSEWMIDLLGWSITLIFSSVSFLIGVNYVF